MKTEKDFQTTDAFLVAYLLHWGYAPTISYLDTTVIFSYPKWSKDKFFRAKLKAYQKGSATADLARVREIYDDIRHQIYVFHKEGKQLLL